MSHHKVAFGRTFSSKIVGPNRSYFLGHSLADIGHMAEYKTEMKHMLTLRKNVSTTNNVCRINTGKYLSNMFRAIILLGICQLDVITWDHLYKQYFCSYVVTLEDDQNKILKKIIKNNEIKERGGGWKEGRRERVEVRGRAFRPR